MKGNNYCGEAESGEKFEKGKMHFARARNRIRSAFALSDKAETPIIVWPLHYIVFGTHPKEIPADLFENPARLLEFQTERCERHLTAIDDDFQPYLVPYYGTGILASAFGCKTDFHPYRDPAIAAPCIQSPADAAKLRLPNPERDGLMPRVLEAAAYMRNHSSYPVGLTDSQSPLDELILMCGHERLYIWMYEEPSMVHALFNLAAEAFILWVKAQKAVTGEPLDACFGEQGVWVPSPCGVWMADDEAVNLPLHLYREFVVPCYSKIFREFSGGVLHFCGNGSHLASALLEIDGLRAINSGPMSKPADFAKLQQSLGNKVPLIYQEFSPVEPEIYYRELLGQISLRGLILAPIVTDLVAIGSGGFVNVKQNREEAARRIYDFLQQEVDRLSGLT